MHRGMGRRVRLAVGTITTLTAGLVAGCGHKNTDQTAAGDVMPSSSTPVATTPVAPIDTVQEHHSKLGGALVGAAAGHVLGGHAMAGAAVGALVQHERNKHAK